MSDDLVAAARRLVAHLREHFPIDGEKPPVSGGPVTAEWGMLFGYLSLLRQAIPSRPGEGVDGYVAFSGQAVRDQAAIERLRAACDQIAETYGLRTATNERGQSYEYVEREVGDAVPMLGGDVVLALEYAVRVLEPAEAVRQGRRRRSTEKTEFGRWAFGFDSRQWFLFRKKKVGDRVTWIEPSLAERLKGQPAQFALAIAEHGGAISREEAVGLFRTGDRRRMSPKGVYKNVVVPTRSKLAIMIREAVARACGVEKIAGDPVRWDANSQSWRAVVEVGYAVKDDDDRIQFRTAEQLRAGEDLARRQAR